MSHFLENLNWRYATKRFDTSRNIENSIEEKILESIRLAPTSFGLQPFRVHVVKDQRIKDKIQAAGWNQAQYGTAPLILVFTSLLNMEKRINDFLTLATGGDTEARAKLKGYEEMMRGFLVGKDPAWLEGWAAKQSYIALGFAMAACAELNIDSCPMEGFAPKEVDKILALAHDEKTSVILTIGYRSEDEKPRSKVRFSKDEMFC